jgi:glycosyltransferase domain-containing protein
VPTFNRPPDLARLLTSLARQGAPFPVLVLDSSGDEARAANAALVGRLPLEARLLAFEPSITPFEKFWRGAEAVRTEFAALCADDDVVLLDALPPLVRHLQREPGVAAAHGLYFTFYLADHVGLTSLVYAGRSFDGGQPLDRLADLFRRYEAVTYAVYRTAVMRHVLGAVLPLESMLGRELLGGALTVVAGQVARLPILHYGRSLHPSGPYEHWHPIDFLVSSPRAMLEDYGRYRRVLLASLASGGAGSSGGGAGPGAPADTLRLVDLIHLRYLVDFVSPAMMDYVIDQVAAGTPKADIMRGVWPRLAAPAPGPPPAGAGPALRRLGAWLEERLGRRAPARDSNPGSLRSTTVGGRPREYRLYDAFWSALGQATPRRAEAVANLLRQLDAYE